MARAKAKAKAKAKPEATSFSGAMPRYDWEIKRLAYGRGYYALRSKNLVRDAYFDGDTDEEQHRDKRELIGYLWKKWDESITVDAENLTDSEIKACHEDMRLRLEGAKHAADQDTSDHGYYRVMYQWLCNHLYEKDGKTLVTPEKILVTGNRRFEVTPEAVVENITGYGVLKPGEGPKPVKGLEGLEDHQKMVVKDPFEALLRCPVTTSGRFDNDSDRVSLQLRENTVKDQGQKKLADEELLRVTIVFVKMGHNQNFVRGYCSSSTVAVRFWYAANLVVYADDIMKKEKGWNFDVLGRLTNPIKYPPGKGKYIGMSNKVMSHTRLQGFGPRLLSDDEMYKSFKDWDEWEDMSPAKQKEMPFRKKKRFVKKEFAQLLYWLANQEAPQAPRTMKRPQISTLAGGGVSAVPIIGQRVLKCVLNDSEVQEIPGILGGRVEGYDVITRLSDSEYAAVLPLINLFENCLDQSIPAEHRIKIVDVMAKLVKPVNSFKLVDSSDFVDDLENIEDEDEDEDEVELADEPVEA